MNLSDAASAAGKDIAGFTLNRVLEASFSPGRDPTATALGGEPIGADARAARSGNDPKNPNFRDTPDAYFGTKKDVAPGGQVAGPVNVPMLGTVPRWLAIAGGIVLVVLGFRFLTKKRKG